VTGGVRAASGACNGQCGGKQEWQTRARCSELNHSNLHYRRQVAQHGPETGRASDAGTHNSPAWAVGPMAGPRPAFQGCPIWPIGKSSRKLAKCSVPTSPTGILRPATE
jgi:hypothetical protein